VTANKTTAKTAEHDAPQFPMAFQEVIKLVNEGKDPPGIRKIPEQISSDAQKFLGSTSVNHSSTNAALLKPWETKQGEQQPDITVLN